jgi:hypothetical protein
MYVLYVQNNEGGQEQHAKCGRLHSRSVGDDDPNDCCNNILYIDWYNNSATAFRTERAVLPMDLLVDSSMPTTRRDRKHNNMILLSLDVAGRRQTASWGTMIYLTNATQLFVNVVPPSYPIIPFRST